MEGRPPVFGAGQLLIESEDLTRCAGFMPRMHAPHPLDFSNLIQHGPPP
jgi:hypothetical protein